MDNKDIGVLLALQLADMLGWPAGEIKDKGLVAIALPWEGTVVFDRPEDYDQYLFRPSKEFEREFDPLPPTTEESYRRVHEFLGGATEDFKFVEPGDVRGVEQLPDPIDKKPSKGNPWDYFEEDGKYCVYRVEDGKKLRKVACHDTEEQAKKHVAALYANTEDEEKYFEEIERAVWPTAKINDLPDASFLYIEPGGTKDDEGKTTPRSLRHLPVKDENGEVDPAHVRNAIQRAPQVQDKEGNKLPSGLVQRIVARAKKLLEGVTKETDYAIIEGEKEESLIDKIKDKFFGSKEAPPFFSFKDGDNYRWVAISSTAFKDRDKEIISSRALKAEAEENAKGDLGPLRFWHTPGVEFGTCDARFYDGYCLIETGLWRNDEIGEAARKGLSKNKDYWGISIGFLGFLKERESDVAINGDTVRHIWNKIKIFERSVLPNHRASNPFTRIDTQGEETMDAVKMAELEQLLGKDIASKVAEQVDAINAKASANAAVFKEVHPLIEMAETVKESDPLLEAVLKEIDALVTKGEDASELIAVAKRRLPEEILPKFEEAVTKEDSTQKEEEKAFPPKEDEEEDEEDDEEEDETQKAIVSALGKMAARIDSLTKDVQALANDMAPRAALERASQSEDTKIDGEEAENIKNRRSAATIKNSNNPLGEMTIALFSAVGGGSE